MFFFLYFSGWKGFTLQGFLLLGFVDNWNFVIFSIVLFLLECIVKAVKELQKV